MWPVAASTLHSFRPDFARVVSRIFPQGGLLILGGDSEKLQAQFREIGREALVFASCAQMGKACQPTAAATFAFWFYPAHEGEDDRSVSELSRCASEIVLVPSAGASVAKRRLQLLKKFEATGFLPDYGCDLTEIDLGALRLVRVQAEIARISPVGIEAAFSRLYAERERAERTLQSARCELSAAERHIAKLEEEILKLKRASRELKKLQAEKQALRKSPERRIGQVLLAPFRVPQKLIQRLRGGGAVCGEDRATPSAETLEYQRWFERHRATPEQLGLMRSAAAHFANRPLISVITPVFNTVPAWLEETIASVLAQVYEHWELVLVDDGSTASELQKYLASLEQRDRRIRRFALEGNRGISAATNYGVEQARGEWIAFLDHDDLLEPDALFRAVELLQLYPDADLIYSDEDKLTETGFDRPQFKPDWSPDLFLAQNYLGHLVVARRDAIRQLGGCRPEFDGAQDYDLLLRLIERTDRVHHIARILYHWRRSDRSSAINVRQKPGQFEAARRALEEHLSRRGETGRVSVEWRTHTFWVRRELKTAQEIAIVIPSLRGSHALHRCVKSLISRTLYRKYEIVAVYGGEVPFDQQNVESHTPFRALRFQGATGSPAALNFAVEQTDAPWILFLSDAAEPMEPEWLTIMAEHVQRPEIGAVGAQLISPAGIVREAGMVVGGGGAVAQSALSGLPAEGNRIKRQLLVTRNCSAVSTSCLLTRRDVFEQAGRFDESLRGALADADFCLRIRRAGYRIVYTPFARLCLHADDQTDGIDAKCEEILRRRWAGSLDTDPYYNPNLSHRAADFSLGKL